MRALVTRLCALIALTGLAIPTSVGNAVTPPAPPSRTNIQLGNSKVNGSTAPVKDALALVGKQATLITGDVVRLNANGQAVRVRLGRAGGGYHSWTDQAGDAYFVPEAAEPLLAKGKLDLALFNVSGLVRQGYTDGVPVIEKGDEGRSGATLLRSTRSTAFVVRQKAAPGFWSQWTRDGGKLWLDAKVQASLEQSVPQIGAPAAWQRGLEGKGTKVAVLDTGIDLDHADFAGRIGATKDFSGKGDVTDGAGHGTHVASTIAGSGAASHGRYRGVAPGATLMVGKVLGDDGSGSMSDVIEGMEWAASNGADVVNLSLGAAASRGDDPASLALNELSAKYGTLFVVAAGNFSPWVPGNKFVSAPGAANAALTVGAVTKSDHMYSGSRRGRMGDSAIKPELVAPGVNITAAVPGGGYASGTGTSMAAPHVAGTAALLAGQHPSWQANSLKQALTSTTKAVDGATIVEQGAGRVDADRATRQQVTVDTGTFDAGYFAKPFDLAKLRTEKALTYKNEGSAEVTLDLTTSLVNKDFEAASAGALTVSPQRLTLAPGATGKVVVNVDANLVDPSTYTGRVVASGADNLELSTAIGFYKQDDMVDISLKAIDRNGAPAIATMRLAAYKQEDFDARYYPDYIYLEPGETEQVVRVPEGDYNLWATILTPDASGRWIEEKSIVSIPRVHAYAPNPSIVLDARKAKPVSLKTPLPSTVRSFALSWWRGFTGNPYHSYDSMGVMVSDGTPERVSVVGTEAVDDAPFTVTAAFDAAPAPLTAKVIGGPTLHPVQEGGPSIAGKSTLRVASGGDLEGKLFAVRENPNGNYREQVEDAIARGARAVAIYSAHEGVFWPGIGGPIPVITLSKSEGESLARLASRQRTYVQLNGTPTPSYAYDVAFPMQGRVPDRPDFSVRQEAIATITNRMNSSGTREKGFRLHEFITKSCQCSTGAVADYLPWTNHVRTEYVTASPQVQDFPSWQYIYDSPGDEMYPRELREYRPGQRITENWLGAPYSPGPANSTLAIYGSKRESKRIGDWLAYDIANWTDSAGHWTPQVASTTNVSRLFRNGELIRSSDYSLSGGLNVPAEEASYRLEADVDHDGALFGLSTKTRSAWTFKSAKGNYALPLVDMDYTGIVDPWTRRPALSLDSAAGSGSTVMLVMRAGHQLGSTAPAVNRVLVDVSYDDGATWTPVWTRSKGNGEFTTSYRHPRKVNGYVSLRVSASDPDGNALTQTLIRAYRLSR